LRSYQEIVFPMQRGFAKGTCQIEIARGTCLSGNRETFCLPKSSKHQLGQVVEAVVVLGCSASENEVFWTQNDTIYIDLW